MQRDDGRSPNGDQTRIGGALDPSPDLGRNALLRGLPPGELEAVRVSAESVRPRVGQVMLEYGAPIEHLYFPQDAVFTLLTQMPDGAIAETLAVGNEGVIGLPAVLGAVRSPTRVVCLLAGRTIRISVAALTAAAPRDGVLFGRIIGYADARLTTLSQLVACNALHTAQQRYARWVLTMHDRAAADEFPITQDFLSQMLGVTRPTISLVGHDLQAKGLLHYAQGRVTVDDRAGLQGIACDCYDVIRRAFGGVVDRQVGRASSAG